MLDIMTKCPKCQSELTQLADADRDIAYCQSCKETIPDCVVVLANISDTL